eukprot:scaffold161036_cov16-Prasinocladus_malaysianus.AAC.1
MGKKDRKRKRELARSAHQAVEDAPKLSLQDLWWCCKPVNESGTTVSSASVFPKSGMYSTAPKFAERAFALAREGKQMVHSVIVAKSVEQVCDAVGGVWYCFDSQEDEVSDRLTSKKMRGFDLRCLEKDRINCVRVRDVLCTDDGRVIGTTYPSEGVLKAFRECSGMKIEAGLTLKPNMGRNGNPTEAGRTKKEFCVR